MSVWADTHLWRTWKQNENNMKGNECNMRGNECKTKGIWRGNESNMEGDERSWTHQMTSVDSRRRILSHPQKAGKFSLRITKKITSGKTIWLIDIRFFRQPHMLLWNVALSNVDYVGIYRKNTSTQVPHKNTLDIRWPIWVMLSVKFTGGGTGVPGGWKDRDDMREL